MYMYTPIHVHKREIHVHAIASIWTILLMNMQCTSTQAKLPIILFVFIKKFCYLPSLKITLVVLIQLNSLALINSIVLLREKLLERQHNFFGTMGWASHCFTGMSSVTIHIHCTCTVYECKHTIRTHIYMCTCTFLGKNPPAVYTCIP